LLHEDDAPYLQSDGNWENIPIVYTLMYDLAMKHASLVIPTLDAIAKTPFFRTLEFEKFTRREGIATLRRRRCGTGPEVLNFVRFGPRAHIFNLAGPGP